MEVDGGEEPEMPTINDNLILSEIRWMESLINTNLPPNQVIKVSINDFIVLVTQCKEISASDK